MSLVTMPNGRRLKKRPLATGRCSPLCCFAGRFLRRSLSSQRIAPDPRWATHGQRPSARNARTRRSHVVTAARISQRCMGMASPRRVGRIPAGFRRPSNGNTKGHESSIRRSRTLPSLRGGSQQRSGCVHIYIARIARQVRSAHAPLAAKGRPMRTPKWRFAVGHGRTNPAAWRRGSTHPDHRMRGLNRVLLRARIES